tara:strand:+ start:134 stop:313 length:180 start_codon:yes stop_codon:yes gene_type:complete
MGSKFNRCLGLQPYVQVQEEYINHPGQAVTRNMETAIVVVLDEDTGENPESFFYEGSEV